MPILFSIHMYIFYDDDQYLDNYPERLYTIEQDVEWGPIYPFLENNPPFNTESLLLEFHFDESRY